VRSRVGWTSVIALGFLALVYAAGAGLLPTSASFYQLLSAALAIVLIFGWVFLVLRYRFWGVVVVSGLSFALPAIGFAVYAIKPGKSPADAAVVFFVALLYAAIFVALAWRFTFGRRRRRDPLIYSGANETRQYIRGLAGRAFLVLWLSGLLFLVEPGIAIANVALNVAWMALWIPQRLRSREVQNSVQISVRPGFAFEFVTNPKNWPLYREDTELVEVVPDGPLASGTEYVARFPIPKSLQTTSHRHIESRYRVSAVVPGSSFTVTLVDQPGNATRIDFVQVDSGTLMTNAHSMKVPYPQASQGMILTLPRALSVAREADVKRMARLKEILERAPNQ
jgi:hypothetical protein